MTTSNTAEQRLLTEVMMRRHSIEELVLFLFPWGKKGTPLEKYAGPKRWQLDVIRKIDQSFQSDEPKPLYLARSSGRGIGKSALFGMLNVALMSAVPGITIIVTANTEEQLRTRTMAELGKWHTMAINSHWFEKSVLSLHPSKWFAEMVRKELKVGTDYYYAKAQTWSAENPDAFAGIHSDIGTVVLYDEASGIDANIWTVTEGFFTDKAKHRLWMVFSNPRQASGAFFECFHRNSDYWDTDCIDSRTVEGLDVDVFERIIAKYGDDSDEARIEVKGQFPRQGLSQFISTEVVQHATQREPFEDTGAPMMMGVDVARFGDDSSVIKLRQGRNATIPAIKMKGRDTMQVVSEVLQLVEKYDVDHICVDGVGVGAGVVDRLKELGVACTDVQFGASAEDKLAYYNKRTECWGRMKEWLDTGAIDNDDELFTDLTAPQYKYMGDNGVVMLERKDEMKKRGYKSPDVGDALSLTFAVRVARKDKRYARQRNRVAKGLDYDIFG